MIYQSWNYGSLYYNKQLPFFYVFRDVWNIFFTPVPPIAKQIQYEMNAAKLLPGQYGSIHTRAMYAVKSTPVQEIHNMVINAINCLSEIFPQGPYYFASDSKIALQFAAEYGVTKNTTTHVRKPQSPKKKNHNRTMEENEDDPIHLGAKIRKSKINDIQK